MSAYTFGKSTDCYANLRIIFDKLQIKAIFVSF